jgi:hypothetical protein
LGVLPTDDIHFPLRTFSNRLQHPEYVGVMMAKVTRNVSIPEQIRQAAAHQN